MSPLKWEEKIDGLAIAIEIERVVGKQAADLTVISYSQLRPSVWRSDFPGGTRIRDEDFWFTAVEDQAGYRFDRLGFTSDHGIAEELIPTTNGYLSAGSHILEFRCDEFFRLSNVQFISEQAPTRDRSEKRLLWDLVASLDSPCLPAFGAVEWFEFNSRSYLTRFEYSFGMRGAATDEPMIVEDVDFKEYQGRLIVAEARRTEKSLSITRRLVEVGPANQDVDFYTADSLGLERPTKPWPAWMKWGLVSLVLAAATLWIRKRAIDR